MCTVEAYIGKYVYSARNAEKARQSLAFSPVSKPHTHIIYMLRQCKSIVYVPSRLKRYLKSSVHITVIDYYGLLTHANYLS
jgi:Uri superfamily endonuclease